jgi:hypothetical protein
MHKRDGNLLARRSVFNVTPVSPILPLTLTDAGQ